MKILNLVARRFCSALFVLLAVAPLQAGPAVLLRENFDAADGSSAEFPPPDGEFRSLLGGRVTGWAGAGVVRLSHQLGVGVDGSGGLLVTPAEGADDTVYYLATIGPLPFAGRTGETLRAGDLWALRLAFSVRVPIGRSLNCFIALDGPNELKSETWNSRLALPPIVGTGAFVPIVVEGDQFSDENIQAFLSTARKLGARRLRIAVQWYVANPTAWVPGTSFALDDFDLSLTR